MFIAALFITARTWKHWLPWIWRGWVGGRGEEVEGAGREKGSTFVGRLTRHLAQRRFGGMGLLMGLLRGLVHP